jgi:uncharacterized protein (DUF2336 family)
MIKRGNFMSLHTEHKYFDLHGEDRVSAHSGHLLKLAQDATPTGRFALANAVANFFENNEMDSVERHLIIEIMMKLIHRTELDLREALAERLSAIGNVPPEVIIFLANDEISVARPVLQRSPVLNDVDLIYIITSKGAAHWQAIAQREQLSPVVVRRLVDTGEIDVAAQVLENERITLHKSTVSRLVRVSLTSEELQAPLLRRPEVGPEMAAELYTCVSKALRREISQRFNISPMVLEGALDTLVGELCSEAQGLQRVTREMSALAKRFNERGEITPVMMTKALRRGQMSFFIALLAARLSLAPEFIEHLLKKEAHKSFAMACRAVGMMKSEFASIYLLSQTLRTGGKTVDQSELTAALRHYDRIRDADVQRITKEWSRHAGA